MRSAALLLTLLSTTCLAETARAGDYWDSFVREYVQRLDGISPEAGDAQAVNTVTHMIDPWPRYVNRRHIDANGARMADVIERYRDVRKLPLAPQPISPVQIGTSGFSTGGGGGTTTTSSSTASPAGQ